MSSRIQVSIVVGLQKEVAPPDAEDPEHNRRR